MMKHLQPYKSSLILLTAMFIGGTLGILVPEFAIKLKPLGSIFLNLLFMIIVPLVAISVTSSIARIADFSRLRSLMLAIIAVSAFMALIPAILTFGVAVFFNISQGVTFADVASVTTNVEAKSSLDFVNMITTNDFVGLLSKSNILALVIMSILAGIAIGQSGESGKKVSNALDAWNDVVMRMINIIMIFAPIGIGAFFAATMASQDTAILGILARAVGLFFAALVVYYVVGSTLYAYVADGSRGVKTYWKNVIPPSITALGTASSLGTLPVNIKAARSMGINDEVVDIALPLMVNINKGGVGMIVAVKIVFIYGLLGIPITFEVFMVSMLIAVLSAVIVGGVPGGAFLGEIFIIGALGLPIEALPILVLLGIITDAPTTVVNVVHDLNGAQLVEKFTKRKKKIAIKA